MIYDDSPYFDRSLPVDVSQGAFLPHWHQDGKMQFVTFRLADSLPRGRRLELERFAKLFEQRHPRPWDQKIQWEYNRHINNTTERLLNAGYGSCLLRHSEVRQIVADTIMYGDGTNYMVEAFVIMPNHVHILLCLSDTCSLDEVMRRIRQFSSRKVNRITGATGNLWMPDYFDRIIRTPNHLAYCLDYIDRNPRHLPQSHYTLYHRPRQ
ncbi:MAG: transposase [Paramuribaculum sp.]|nr:transposase [Paramuribaculum sp.]